MKRPIAYQPIATDLSLERVVTEWSYGILTARIHFTAACWGVGSKVRRSMKWANMKWANERVGCGLPILGMPALLYPQSSPPATFFPFQVVLSATELDLQLGMKIHNHHHCRSRPSLPRSGDIRGARCLACRAEPTSLLPGASWRRHCEVFRCRQARSCAVCLS